MNAAPALPLSASELPPGIRRFGDPKAPGAARGMAARGLVPIKGADLVGLLAQLSADPDAGIAKSATDTLRGLPEGVLLSACDGELHPAFLDRIAELFHDHEAVLDRVVQNGATADATIARVARACSEHLSESIALNQQRLLSAPRIVEALYKNKNTRMSTADRLVELCARHGVVLEGIAAFQQHVEAIRGQLVAEPSDEPLPSDVEFREALEADADDTDAIEQDEVEGTEKLKQKFEPLWTRIARMSISEKVRMATIGEAAARAVLVRDPNRLVAYAAIASPRTNEAEALRFARSKEVGSDILRYIADKGDWARRYEVQRSLMFNPKTPLAIALRFLNFMHDSDLKKLSRSRNVQAPVKQAAQQRINQKQRGSGGRR